MEGVSTMEQQLKAGKLADPAFGFDREAVEAAAEEVVLEPGSMLYFPAGCWHRVEALDDSVSINISLVGQNWSDLVASGLRQRLWSLAPWRRLVRADSYGHAVEQLDGMLRQLQLEVSALRATDFLAPAMWLPRRDRPRPL